MAMAVASDSESAREAERASRPTWPAESVADYFFKIGLPPKHRFQKRVGLRPRNESETWDFLKHANEDQWRPRGSLEETKFHRGFQRRPHKDILADQVRDASHSRPETADAAAAARRAEGARRRHERLSFLHSGCRGYDIISLGDSGPGANGPRRHADFPSLDPARQELPRGRKRFSGHDRDPSPFSGDVRPAERKAAAQSVDVKFYQPRAATAQARRRAEMLGCNGIPPHAKASAVIGFGRADIPSQGVNDNFGNSHYLAEARSRNRSGQIANLLGTSHRATHTARLGGNR